MFTLTINDDEELELVVGTLQRRINAIEMFIENNPKRRSLKASQVVIDDATKRLDTLKAICSRLPNPFTVDLPKPKDGSGFPIAEIYLK